MTQFWFEQNLTLVFWIPSPEIEEKDDDDSDNNNERANKPI